MKRKYYLPQEIKSNNKWRWNRLKYYLGAVEVNVAKHCNLNCAGCTHYSPIADESFVDLDDYINWISLLNEKLPYPFVREIRLLGGEPLMHKDIAKMVLVTREIMQKVRINVVTNGLLCKKMSEDFYKALRQTGSTLSVTIYPTKFDYDGLIEWLKLKNINLKIYNDIGKTGFTYDLLDVSGKYNARKNFANCRHNYCMQLEDNKLYMCPYTAFAETINKNFYKNRPNKFQVCKDDYLDLTQMHSSLAFIKFINSSKPFCRYCALDKIQHHEWKISNKNKSEWLV